jgi:hypothetical protein
MMDALQDGELLDGPRGRFVVEYTYWDEQDNDLLVVVTSLPDGLPHTFPAEMVMEWRRAKGPG